MALIIKNNAGIKLVKCESDLSGRWLVANLIQGMPIVCANYYCPNNDSPEALMKLELCLLETTSHVILGGDFNIVQNKVLDRTSKVKYVNSP